MMASEACVESPEEEECHGDRMVTISLSDGNNATGGLFHPVALWCPSLAMKACDPNEMENSRYQRQSGHAGNMQYFKGRISFPPCRLLGKLMLVL